MRDRRDALNGERVTGRPGAAVRGGVMSESTRYEGTGTAGTGELPDLLGLDLATLRTMDHPVLSEVVADLRGRAEQPKEMLWGFTNAF